MNKNYTTDILLQFIYQELTTTEQAEISEEINCNWALQEKTAVLKFAGKDLTKAIESPRTQAIKTILNYAAHTEKEKSR